MLFQQLFRGTSIKVLYSAMYIHSRTFRGQEGNCPPQFQKFGQNQNFLGGDRNNLGEIKNFRAVIQKDFRANCREKFTNLDKNFFLENSVFLRQKLKIRDRSQVKSFMMYSLCTRSIMYKISLKMAYLVYKFCIIWSECNNYKIFFK